MVAFREHDGDVLDDGRPPGRRPWVALLTALLVGLAAGVGGTTWWLRHSAGPDRAPSARLFAQASSSTDGPGDRPCVSVLLVLHNLADRPVTIERLAAQLPGLREKPGCPARADGQPATIGPLGSLAWVLPFGLACANPSTDRRYTAVARSVDGSRRTVTGSVDTSGMVAARAFCGGDDGLPVLWWTGSGASTVIGTGPNAVLRVSGRVGSGVSTPDVTLISVSTSEPSAFVARSTDMPMRLPSDTDRQARLDIAVRDCDRARRFADSDLTLTATSRPASRMSGTLADGPRAITVGLVRLVDVACGVR